MTTRCSAVSRNGYRCEINTGERHDTHRAFVNECDEYGKIPEFRWRELDGDPTSPRQFGDVAGAFADRSNAFRASAEPITVHDGAGTTYVSVANGAIEVHPNATVGDCMIALAECAKRLDSVSSEVPRSTTEQDAPTHELKVWPEFFTALSDGRKTFEFRRDDRSPPYQVGDVLRLREYDGGRFGETFEYTGLECLRRVTYIARYSLVIPGGYCCMSIEPLARLRSPSEETDAQIAGAIVLDDLRERNEDLRVTVQQLRETIERLTGELESRAGSPSSSSRSNTRETQ